MKVPYRFKAVFDILPEAEKDLPICILEGKRYTWKEVYKELEDESYLGKRMLAQLISYRFVFTVGEWATKCKAKGVCDDCGTELVCPRCDLDDPIEDVNQDSARDQAETRREAHD